MAATVTTLDREIAREERFVGLPTDEPLTDAAIARRRVQIAGVLGACAFVTVFAMSFGTVSGRLVAIGVGFAFGIYAIEKDRHLRRLALLRGDSLRITLVVAGELMHSGALAGDRELLDLRDRIGCAAGQLASGLAEVVPTDAARVRLLGPCGEVPVAAERDSARIRVPDEPHAAIDALRLRRPIRTADADSRGVLVVPMWRGDEIVALLEAVGAPGDRFTPRDAAQVDGYGRGVVAALLAPPTS
jgi:hypothetical protein